jgi:hypothetical protein
MPARQLLLPRIGSIAEDEVASLIRRIAFINRPLAPDDIGADFVCAVAEKRNAGKNPHRLMQMLYAGGWFLISVKSGDAAIGLERSSDHFDWFLKLELPFLVARVEPGAELKISIFHTLRHIAAISKLPSQVQSVEFRCENSPQYKPLNYRIDRLDVIEIQGEQAIAWLGPPLMVLTRQKLLDEQFRENAAKLLQSICSLHPSIHRYGRAGMEIGVMWETDKSITTPVKTYNMSQLVKTTKDVVDEIKIALDMERKRNDLIANIWQASQPLFNFYDAMNIAEIEGKPTIEASEIFNFASNE